MFKKSTAAQISFKLALLASIAAAAAISAPSFAATAPGTATATVVIPIAITNTVPLAFGKFSSAVAGDITVSTASLVTVTGGVTQFAGAGSPPTAASFNITGEPNYTFGITTSATTVTSGANSMPLALVTNAATGTLDATGAVTLKVGGKLTVGASQPKGAYTGTFSVDVNYN